MKKLRAVGLLSHDPNGLGEGEPDFPAWEVSVTYAWTITFPPRKIVSINHTYAPFLGLGSAGNLYKSDIEQNTLASICSSPALLSKMSNLPAYGIIPGARVGYILTTANTWKKPIRNFTLRLKKSSPTEIISLCFPGNFAKIDALTLESRIADFVPTSELLIQFLDPSHSVQYGDTVNGYGQAPQVTSGPIK
jgi:hypothetical protein